MREEINRLIFQKYNPIAVDMFRGRVCDRESTGLENLLYK